MAPEIIEGWRIERAVYSEHVGFIATSVETPSRNLQAWTNCETLNLNAMDLWAEQFPIAMVARLIELRAAAINEADRDT